jgi:aminomethyltransferase
VASEALRRTPLYEEHKALGARLVDFAGWEMPVQYEGIKAEHGAVRTRVGLFDVSHMGEVVFRGPQAEEAVQRLVTRDVSRLVVGQAGYAAVCYESGGTVDDVLVYRTQDDFLVVVNASNREKDVEHFKENTGDLDVEVVDESDQWALLALQGPEAAALLQAFTETDLSSIKYYRYEVGEVEGAYAVISRTGYTGEDGFELFVRSDDAPDLWRRLIESGAAPVGLGARDTLRLEAGIGFAVHLNKKSEFIGQRALRREQEEGLRKKLVGFKVEGRGIARHDYPVTVDGETVGSVTSGTLSPTLNEAIGLALVAPGVEDRFEVAIRNRTVSARAVPLPFYKREK